MDRKLIPEELKGNSTMTALINANDAAEVCNRLTSLLQTMSKAPHISQGEKEQCLNYATEAAEISKDCIEAATYLFIETVTRDITEKNGADDATTEKINSALITIEVNANSLKNNLEQLMTESRKFIESLRGGKP